MAGECFNDVRRVLLPPPSIRSPSFGTRPETRSLPLLRWTLGAPSARLREGSPLGNAVCRRETGQVGKRTHSSPVMSTFSSIVILGERNKETSKTRLSAYELQDERIQIWEQRIAGDGTTTLGVARVEGKGCTLRVFGS